MNKFHFWMSGVLFGVAFTESFFHIEAHLESQPMVPRGDPLYTTLSIGMVAVALMLAKHFYKKMSDDS